jgi:hypothetical protein
MVRTYSNASFCDHQLFFTLKSNRLLLRHLNYDKLIKSGETVGKEFIMKAIRELGVSRQTW